MSKVPTPLPSYKKPPIIEAVWSVQFSGMPWLLASHTGLFWNRIRDRFPCCEEQPPIAHVIEKDGIFSPPVPEAKLLTVPPLSRQWFVSSDGNELIQLQRDRLCCNWRKVQPADIYPRYEHMRQLFDYSWEALRGFVAEVGKTSPVIDQCEMTYINHIDHGQGWEAIEQIGDVFPFLTWQGSRDFLPSPTTFGAQFSFDIPALNGRLHVSLRHGLKKGGNVEENQLFLLELTARGLPAKTDPEGLADWYSLARESIVRGFTDLTSKTVHRRWERER